MAILHNITLDFSNCKGKSTCGTRIFIDDKEIHGITEISNEISSGCLPTITITMMYNDLITKNATDNEVDDGK